MSVEFKTESPQYYQFSGLIGPLIASIGIASFGCHLIEIHAICQWIPIRVD
jgi:hypothetical protein